jgi:plastocyanin
LFRTVIAVALVATAVGGCGGSSGTDSESPAVPFHAKVKISDGRYTPAHVKVRVGGTVTWVNQDRDAFHTAETKSRDTAGRTWDEQTDWDSHTLTWGEPFTHTFGKPGTYEYHSSFDSSMRGTVEVLVKADAMRENRR